MVALKKRARLINKKKNQPNQTNVKGRFADLTS